MINSNLFADMASHGDGDGGEFALNRPLKAVDPQLYEIILKEKVGMFDLLYWVLTLFSLFICTNT